MKLHELSRSARIGLTVALAVMVVGSLAGLFYLKVIDTPERRAEKKFDAAIAAVAHGDAEAALRSLDALLASPDRARVSAETEARVGAEIVRLSASRVAEPFTRASLDQEARVLVRYQTLPPRAREGKARDAMLAALDRWIDKLGKPGDELAKLELLRHAADISDRARSDVYSQRIVAARLAAGKAKATNAPLDALALLVDEPRDAACLAEASKILGAIADRPSLLEEAALDVEMWLGAAKTDPLAKRIEDQLALGRSARAEAEAEDVTTEQLASMLQRRPWDQRAAVALAAHDIEAGKLADADARLRAFGPPQLLIRDARAALGSIALAQNKLDVADELYSGLIGPQLARFVEASTKLETTAKALQDQVASQFENGDIPADVVQRMQNQPEDKQREVAIEYFNKVLDADPNVKKARAMLERYQDIVPVSVAAGTVKIRRAQTLQGAARDAMLKEAEDVFLAVRAQAEGQPRFHLGLGEVYARLGKPKESDEELNKVLDLKTPELSLAVATVYRNIGSDERAKQVAKGVYDTASSPSKEAAASLLGILTTRNEEESEGWFRKANQKDSFVQQSLLELSARRLMREGKWAECDRKFAESAKRWLATATPGDSSAYNNAAIAHQGRFACTGDLGALTDAEAALEKAYRTGSEHPILVENLASLYQSDAQVRVIAKHIDVHALRVNQGEAEHLIEVMLAGSERDKVLAELAADRGWRRSAELYAQAEVLGPNNPEAYTAQVERAARRRDEQAATTVLERLRHAKALDTSNNDDRWTRWLAGTDDDKFKQQVTSLLQRYDQLLATKQDPKTRAALLELQCASSLVLGRFGDVDALARGRAAHEEAGKLWPALAAPELSASLLVDEAGMRADAKRWTALRRERSSAAALVQLGNDPLVAKIKASPQWAQVAGYLRAVTSRPTLEELRLARLLGDAALIAKFSPVLDDKLVRVTAEANAITSPKEKAYQEDVAYFDKR